MKRLTIYSTFFFLLVLSTTVLASNESAYCYVFYLIKGNIYYLIPKIYVDTGLSINSTATITVTVWKQSIDYPPDFESTYRSLYNKSTTTGQIIKPDGNFTNFNFTLVGNGNYTYSYQFATSGTYILEVVVENETDGVGYSMSRGSIYVTPAGVVSWAPHRISVTKLFGDEGVAQVYREEPEPPYTLYGAMFGLVVILLLIILYYRRRAKKAQRKQV